MQRNSKAAKAPEWVEGQELTSALAAPLRKGFLGGVATLQKQFGKFAKLAVINPTFNIVGAVSNFDFSAFEDGFVEGWDQTIKAVLVRSRNKELAKIGLRVAKADSGSRLQGTVAEELALDYVATRGGVFVQKITGSVRAGINIAVLEGIDTGVGIPKMARDIQDVIGLTERDARAVIARGKALKAEGASDAQIAKAKKNLHKRFLRRRARNIARTETISARNNGQMQAWQLAINEGKLDSDMKKVWIMADGCSICTELASLDPVPVNQPFDSPDVGFIMAPPAHPSCRCSLGLVE